MARVTGFDKSDIYSASNPELLISPSNPGWEFVNNLGYDVFKFDINVSELLAKRSVSLFSQTRELENLRIEPKQSVLDSILTGYWV